MQVSQDGTKDEKPKSHLLVKKDAVTFNRRIHSDPYLVISAQSSYSSPQPCAKEID